ncbi:hypothetical protein LX64_01846 [Chitinophaga skermanii]|uniref:Uncharacterized protein n=1 Tax=Chitinophaga skermanii TaxID=331697 RepID=A0A327QQ64_9BACT|nr:hypothetical protein LX64_01846 [Chitinophaga skermanii]
MWRLKAAQMESRFVANITELSGQKAFEFATPALETAINGAVGDPIKKKVRGTNK